MLEIIGTLTIIFLLTVSVCYLIVIGIALSDRYEFVGCGAVTIGFIMALGFAIAMVYIGVLLKC